MPWSNRIRDGKLRWAGKTYQLRVNHGDGTAIHGTASEYPWAVVESSPTHAVLEFASREVYGVNFPWTFTARFTYALDGDRFTWTYGLINSDHETFPAGFGHHPYFLRSVAGSPTAHLQLNADTGVRGRGVPPVRRGERHPARRRLPGLSRDRRGLR